MVKDERGQSLLEFALILPLLLLLIIGIFDFGRVLYSYMHLHLTTQETVRLGGLGKSDSEMREFARNMYYIGEPELLEVEILPSDSQRKSGQYVTVTLKYPVEFVTPVVSQMISSFKLVTDSTIRVE